MTFNTLEDFDKPLIFTSHLDTIYNHMTKSMGVSKLSINSVELERISINLRFQQITYLDIINNHPKIGVYRNLLNHFLELQHIK